MMTIGEFALHSGLSVKALRSYDERALLPAAHIDPQSGYRHYRTDQLRDAVTIRVLRAAGMPLDLVGQALAEPDRLDALLDEHRRALAARRDLEDRGLALTARLGDWQHGAEVAVRQADGLEAVPDASLDLIVTNPPFHLGSARDSGPTLRMLADAARALRPGGELWCVYNSHLPGGEHLPERVGRTRQVARTRAYTVTRNVNGAGRS